MTTTMPATIPCCCLCAISGRLTPSTPWPGGPGDQGIATCDDCRTQCADRAAQRTSPFPPPDAYFLPTFMGIVVTFKPEKSAEVPTNIIDFAARRRAHLAARAVALLAALFFVVLGSVSLFARPAYANVQEMCASRAAGTVPGPRQVTNPSTGTVYTLKQNGCALMAQTDVAYFTSQGFYPGAGVGAAYLATSANGTLVIPAYAYIDNIIVDEVGGSTITGGLDIGTSNGATDIVSALTVTGSLITKVADTALLKRVFYTAGSAGVSAPQTIYFNAHTSWAAAKALITVLYRFY